MLFYLTELNAALHSLGMKQFYLPSTIHQTLLCLTARKTHGRKGYALSFFPTSIVDGAGSFFRFLGEIKKVVSKALWLRISPQTNILNKLDSSFFQCFDSFIQNIRYLACKVKGEVI